MTSVEVETKKEPSSDARPLGTAVIAVLSTIAVVVLTAIASSFTDYFIGPWVFGAGLILVSTAAASHRPWAPPSECPKGHK